MLLHAQFLADARQSPLQSGDPLVKGRDWATDGAADAGTDWDGSDGVVMGGRQEMRSNGAAGT